MRFFKTLLRRSWFKHSLTLLGAAYLRWIHRSATWHECGEVSGLRKALRNGEPVILAAWHGRLACPPLFLPEGCRPAVMASRHADGDLLAGVLRRLNADVVAGSSGNHGRGAVLALREAIRLIRQGRPVAITPDGPRGPRMQAKPGTAAAAKAAGAAIYPVTFSCRSGISFRTWDRFLLPLPYTTGTVVVGEPLRYEEFGCDLNALSLETAERLNRLTQECDALYRRRRVTPAPYARRPGGKRWRIRRILARRAALRRTWPGRWLGL